MSGGRPASPTPALGQDCVGGAPVCLVVAFDPERLRAKYGEWSERYCWLEAGHVAQNILLQATSLDLAGVPVGAFHDGDVAAAMRLPRGVQPACLLPVGCAAGDQTFPGESSSASSVNAATRARSVHRIMRYVFEL